MNPIEGILPVFASLTDPGSLQIQPANPIGGRWITFAPRARKTDAQDTSPLYGGRFG